MIRVGNAWVSLERHEAFHGDKPVRIGSRAFALLEALLAAPGRLVTKEELIQAIWPDTVVEENNLHVHVSTLRRMLDLDRHTLETLPGRGYRLNLAAADTSDINELPASSAPLEATLLPTLLADESSSATVHVIDDEPAVRAGLVRQLRSASIIAVGYAGADAFLQNCEFDRPGCLLLDVRLSQGTGFDLQAELTRRQAPYPIVFMTGFGTIDMSVRAMKAGAEEFLTKPFDEERLLACVRHALAQAESRFDQHRRCQSAQARFATLTRRELDVFDALLNGHSNKDIATHLGLKDVTVKVHKKHIMAKLGTRTLAELLWVGKMAGKLPDFDRSGIEHNNRLPA